MNTPSSLIFEIMNIFRAYGHERECLYGLCYVLYCLKKDYRVYFMYDNYHKVTDLKLISENNQHFKDHIIHEYPIESIRMAFVGMPEKSISILFETLSKINLNNKYVDIIDNLVEVFAPSSGRMQNSFTTPHHIVTLINKVLSTLSIQKIYNPFSGLGSILSSLRYNDIKGEEPFIQGALVSKIRLEAHGIDAASLTVTNPLVHSFPEGFDAFVSVPPFMLRVPNNEEYLDDINHKTRSVEDVLLWRFLNNSSCRTGVIIVPAGIGFDKSYKEVRAALVEAGCVESVISLPNGIFYATGVSTLLLVLNKDKKDASIRFIDATKSFYREGKRNVLDSALIFRQYTGEDDHSTYSVSVEDISDRDYSFIPSMYYLGNKQILPEGYKEFKFGEVFQVAKMAMCSPDDEGYILKPGDFSRNLLDIYDSKKGSRECDFFSVSQNFRTSNTCLIIPWRRNEDCKIGWKKNCLCKL